VGDLFGQEADAVHTGKLGTLTPEYEPVRAQEMSRGDREGTSGSTRGSLLLLHRQAERKDRAVARFAARPDFSRMVFNNLFANGEAAPRARGLAVRGEGLEQGRLVFRRTPLAGVFDFRDPFFVGPLETQFDLAAIGHRVAGVVNDVVKNVGQP